MLLVTDSITRLDGSDVKVMKPLTFVSAATGQRRAIAWLFVRVVSFRGRVESTSTELKCLVVKYRPLEQSATNLVTCIIESYPLSKKWDLLVDSIYNILRALCVCVCVCVCCLR